MRTRVATLGAVLIIVALFFYLNPALTGPLTTSTGLVSEDTVLTGQV